MWTTTLFQKFTLISRGVAILFTSKSQVTKIYEQGVSGLRSMGTSSRSETSLQLLQTMLIISSTCWFRGTWSTGTVCAQILQHWNVLRYRILEILIFVVTVYLKTCVQRPETKLTQPIHALVQRNLLGWYCLCSDSAWSECFYGTAFKQTLLRYHPSFLTPFLLPFHRLLAAIVYYLSNCSFLFFSSFCTAVRCKPRGLNAKTADNILPCLNHLGSRRRTFGYCSSLW